VGCAGVFAMVRSRLFHPPQKSAADIAQFFIDKIS